MGPGAGAGAPMRKMMVLGHLVVSRDLQVVSYVLCLSLCSVVLGVAWGPD